MFRHLSVVRHLFAAFVGVASVATIASGAPILQGVPTDFLIPIDLDGNSDATPFPSSGCGETAKCLIDQTLAKHTNIGGTNSGFIVTPGIGSTVINGFELTTANDAPDRDPASFMLWGTNDPVTSGFGSTGSQENWVLIASGTLSLSAERDTLQGVVPVSNSVGYTSYRMVFPTLKNNRTTFMQLAEVQFFQSDRPQPVPEPSALLLLGGGLAAGIARRRRA